MDTPSRMNHPSSMEMPQIGWLFDECLDNSNIVDVFDGVVLENCDCDEEMDTCVSSHVYTVPGIENESTVVTKHNEPAAYNGSESFIESSELKGELESSRVY